jgi:ribosome-binding protein aMBF1 (putative translation factor)
MPRNLSQNLNDELERQPAKRAEKRKAPRLRQAPAAQGAPHAVTSEIGFDQSRGKKATKVAGKHRVRGRLAHKADRVIESQMQRQSFAKNFRAARKDAGLSQRDIQMKTGIPQSHISEIESAMHNICIETMVKLANLVHVPVHELLKP